MTNDSNIMRLYQMEAGYSGPKTELARLPEWQSHFDRYSVKSGSYEIPRPFMAKIKIEDGYAVNCEKTLTPILAGGLCPYGERYFECGKVWVYVIEKKKKDGGYKSGHYWIDQRRIVDPSMDEYQEFFKKDVENLKYFIENKLHKGLGEEISRVSIR